ncbi:MAG: small ribosomal subunit Rsm22 family protein [Chlamydiales bacterium]|nr:small ribosomal subunit Rsm22 family protein [Chlamydiales bacterium]
MTLPQALQLAIEELTSSQSLTALTRATQDLSDRYRNQGQCFGGPLLSNDAHRLAYLTMRLPATYEAVYAVVRELSMRAPDLRPGSLLDVGAGPGTGMWAVSDAFESLQKITLVEQDSSFIAMGRTLASDSTLLSNAEWLQADMSSMESLLPSDLVLLSYSIGELGADKRENILKQCWEAAQQALIVIEPGTPRGYETILQVRKALIALGGNLVAPCPHMDCCPMQGTTDWCHFPCRVPRTSTHRQVKNATLGHEDEKFSYVVFTKGSGERVHDRVVRHPLRKSGHVHMELCSLDGLKQTIISKKQGEAYQWAKKADWGDGR